MPKQPQQPESFEDKIKKQEQKAIEDMEKVVMPKRFDFSVRRAEKRAIAYESQLKNLFRTKAAEMTQSFLDLKGIEIRQGEEIREIQEDFLEKKHNIALGTLLARFDLMMEISGKGTISTKEEMLNFFRTGYMLLEQMDTDKIVLEALEGSGITASHLNIELGSIRPDFTRVIEKIYKNQKFDEKDWSMILTQARELANNGVNTPKDSLGMLVLSYLKPKQRLELVQRMVDAGDPDVHNLIITMVGTNYLTIDQGEYLINESIKKIEEQQKKEGRKTRKQLEAEITKMQYVLKEIKSPAMREQKEAALKAIKKGTRILRRSYGHKNYARELFSLKGIGSTIMYANGALTVAANLLVNITSPVDMVANPALWLGVGMVTVGAEFGFPGEIGPRPSRMAAKLLEDKDETAKEKQGNIESRLLREFGNNSTIEKFYYENSDLIVDTYLKKKKKLGRSNININFEDLGLKFEELPAEFRQVSQKSIEHYTTRWVRTMSRTEYGLSRQDAESQRKFINKTRSDRALPEYPPLAE